MTVISLSRGLMRQHIPGHKELSDHVDIMEVEAGSKVFIPLIYEPPVDPEILVKGGNHVSIDTKAAQCNERNAVPIFTSVSGTVAGTQKLMHFSLKPAERLVVENDGSYKRVRSFESLDYKSADRTVLIDSMMDTGIIGLGGVGFPVYIKYRFAKDVKKLIINAVKCEPSIAADFKMVQAHKEELITGMVATKKAAMAPETVIAIKKTHPDLIQPMEEAVKGIEGFSVAAAPGVYPMGWRRISVREIIHAGHKKLPSEVGAIADSAAAVIAFDDALLTRTPIVSKTSAVSGNAIKRPVNVQVPVGVSVFEIVAVCDGCTCESVELIVGGPAIGETIVNDKLMIGHSINALTILENKPFDSIACLHCGKCSDRYPAGLQPVCTVQAVKIDDEKVMEKLCAVDYIEYSLCTYTYPSRLDMIENVRRAERQLTLAKK